MFDNKTIEELADKLSKVLPPGFDTLQKDVQKSFRAILTETFKKLDLVTRQEFDVQSEVLLRTREKVEALEKTISALEQSLSVSAGKDKIKKESSGHKNPAHKKED